MPKAVIAFGWTWEALILMTLNPDLSFPESDKEAIHNLALAQGILIDFLEGIVQQMYEDDQDLLVLWQGAKALQASVEVYGNG